MRLAAKIAYEWLCYKRGIDTVLNDDFNPIRKFILGLHGDKDEPVASIITDHNILSSLDNIPFGIHAIIITPSTERSQVALVGFFGIIYCKIILQRYYNILTTEQPLVLINPQRNVVYEPIFKYRSVAIRARDKDRFVKSSEAVKKIYDRTLRKINVDLKEIMKCQNDTQVSAQS